MHSSGLACCFLLCFCLMAHGQSEDTSNTPAEDIPPPIPQPDAQVERLPGPSEGSDDRINAFHFGVALLPVENGMHVEGVVVDSPASAAGVKPNDVIVSVNGKALENIRQLQDTTISSVGIVRGRILYELKVPKPDANYRPPVTTAPPDRTVPKYTPRTLSSRPPVYSYTPEYGYQFYSRGTPAYYYDRGNSAYRYYGGPGVSVGIGVGNGGYRRYGGPGVNLNYRNSRGYRGRGRSGFGINVGGFNIRF